MGLEIIGSSHIAKESIDLIRNKILGQKQKIVAVELDAQRFPYLFSKPKKPKLGDLLKLGFAGFLFYIIGNFVQKSLGKRVGIMPGADMKEAVKSAMAINAKLFLIDQPIQTTLQILSKKMSFWEKLALAFFFAGGLFLGGEKIEFDMKKVPEAKIINLLTSELMKKFPSLYEVLVERRNRFMAHQLLAIQRQFPDADILAVVGAGHIEGLRKLLKTADF